MLCGEPPLEWHFPAPSPDENALGRQRLTCFSGSRRFRLIVDETGNVVQRSLVEERVTAIALVPLTLWFVASVIAHACSDYTVFTAWVRTPLATSGMILLLIALFHHAALGLQVVIEDCVHSGAKFAAIIAVRLGCYGLAGSGSSPRCGLPLAVE